MNGKKIEINVKENVNNNKMDNKTCDKCNLTVTYKNWLRHLKSIRHQNNDIYQAIKPTFRKTFKGIPTEQIRTKKEKIPKTKIEKIPKPRKDTIPKPHRVFNFSAKLFEKNNTIRPILKTKETAFKSRLITYTIKNSMGIKDVQVFLNRLDNPVIGRLKQALKKKNLKVNIMFLVIHKRGNDEEIKECNFKTQNTILIQSSNLSDFYTNKKM